ncbi:VCBS domain-containing protein [Microbulbifer discodermiae]|uniref:VCBS domain-containing protein n=1 Tax=Microbulbifer sp. 2201CG32-9 TaxID=3232309 RepID=UPI00345B8B62
MNKPLKSFALCSLSALLVACGGGGSSDNGDDAEEVPTSVISGGEGSVVENTTTTASGRLVDSADGGRAFEASHFQGLYGELETSADGSWTYTLDSELADPLDGGEQVVDAFTVGVDGSGTTATVTLSVTGYDDPYSFQPESPLALVVAGTKTFASGTLTLEDVDGNTPEFTPGVVSGSYGDFRLDAGGAWEYSLNSNVDSLNAGESATDSVTFTLSDGSEQTVVFSVSTLEATENTIVFVLMNFSDGSATDRASMADIADMVFNDVDSLDNSYRKNSLGQLGFLRHRTNDNSLDYYCYGEPGIEESSLDCLSFDIPDSQNGGILSMQDAADRAGLGGEYTDRGFTWRDKAYQWARDNFVDDQGQPLNLRDWRHQVFIYPQAARTAGLVGTGIASVTGGMSMVVSSSDQNILGHELGHNIGLGHAGWDSNNDGDVEDSGDSEYGTDGAFMGNRFQSRLFGGAHRDYLEWYSLFPQYSVSVERLANSARDLEIQAIELTAGELAGDLPQQVKVASAGSRNGQSYYYVNYHVAHEVLNPRPHFQHSVTVHYLNGRTSNHVAVLKEPGDSFSDESAGLSIAYKSRDAARQSAVITVTYGE